MVEACGNQELAKKRPRRRIPGTKAYEPTHQSKTDRTPTVSQKEGTGNEAELLGQVLLGKRNGIIVDAVLTRAASMAERDSAMCGDDSI
jgi:hypothetical protein